MSLLPGELSTGYRPRPATNDLKEIVEIFAAIHAA